MKVRDERKRSEIIKFVVAIGILIGASPLIGELALAALNSVFVDFGHFAPDMNYVRCVKKLMTDHDRQILTVFALLLIVCALLSWTTRLHIEIAQTDTIEIARGIHIPVVAGNGQYGTAHFMTKEELDTCFPVLTYDGAGHLKGLAESAGLIVDFHTVGNTEYIRCLVDAANAIIIGATRSGKTRRLLLTATWLNLLLGINLFIPDVKGEIYAYTSDFARKKDYEIRVLDFRNPTRSQHFNNLDEIVRLLAAKKISEAVNKAWDIVTVLVGEPQGERIWTDGQCATIAAAILIIAQDAPEGYKNLTNVYYFLAYMCEPDRETGEMPITRYLEKLPESHPARGAFQVAQIAPFRTRSSFFTSALATLRLYTDWNVAEITSQSDWTLDDIDDKKVITYIILPDEKTTYHPIGALLLKQIYEKLVEIAIRKGGELDRRFIFRTEEIGNFPKIPDLGTMLSAGAGRNIFFELVIQDYQQLEHKYKEEWRNIRTNCQLIVVLKVTDPSTASELSKQLGNYTVQMNAASANVNDGRTGSYSAGTSSSLGGRPLMYPDDISAIEKPDALILYGGKKFIANLPDISEYYANAEFGMGDKNHNKKLYLKRIEDRPAHEINAPKLWSIWEKYKTGKQQTAETLEEEKVSFLT